MAQNISIGTARNLDLIKAKLGRELKVLEGEGVKVNFKESPAGKYTFLSFQVADYGCGHTKEDKQAIFRYHIAELLSDLILGQWEKLFLQDIIRESYYYFSEEERRNILEYALGYIGHPERAAFRPGLKRSIIQKLLEFLNHNNSIIIEGFIRFRLKEYVDELQQAVDRAVDNFLMEREYREFIQLLKYFVEIQEPRVDLVHVIIQPGGFFQLLDEQKQVIKTDSLEGLIMELADGEINYEDMLISTLITLAPKQIVFHNLGLEQKESTIETIRNVFYGRVRECSGCKICRKN